MFGGVGKPAGWVTILVAGGVVLASGVSARAADLGGDCCADLEERVAELEATTARKGNRKVSLKISGWINEQVLFWDDSEEQNVYVGNNDQERSRFKFAGDAKINDEWSAGYTLEIGVRTTKSSSYNQNDDEGGTGLDIRKSSWFIKSKKLGKFTMGRDGSATYHLLDDSDFTNTRFYADAESMPTIGASKFFLVTTAGRSALTWSSLLPTGNTSTSGNGERPDIVRYDSPAFQGFSVSAAWGEDDLWDVAGYYEGEVGDFKLAGRVGYAEYTDGTSGPGSGHCAGPGGGHCAEWGGSATIQHKPTGLFVYGAYGAKRDDDRDVALGVAGVDDTDQIYYIQAGIEQKWTPLGTTSVFGTFRHDDVGARGNFTVDAKSNLPLANGDYFVGSSDLDTWGGGVIQNIANAAMDLYFIYSHVDGSFDAVAKSGGAVSSGVDLESLQLFQAGARIQF
jgi:predicted porin